MLNNSKPLLFLSGGKDSAALACAFSEMGLSKQVHSLTYRAENNGEYQDESKLAILIANKLNLSHEVIDINDYKVKPDSIQTFFSKQLIPSLDLCSTIYLHCGLENYSNSHTLVDALGNDSYLGYLAPRKELRISEIQRYLPYWFKNYIGHFRENRLFMIASKTRSEMVGLWSFLSQTPLIDELLPYKERRLFWQSIDQDHIEKDYIDTRASLRGRYIDQEKFIRKVKNAAKAYELGVS